MMNKLLTNYKRRFNAKTWKELLDAKVTKQNAANAQTAEVTQTNTKVGGNVPVHPPHIIFERSYLNHEGAIETELKIAHEAIRHLEFHQHEQHFAY